MLSDKDKYDYFKKKLVSKKFQKMLNMADSIKMNRTFLVLYYETMLTFLGEDLVMKILTNEREFVEDLNLGIDDAELKFDSEDA